MSLFIPRQVDLYVGRETTRGVGIAPTIKVPKALFDHDLKTTKTQPNLSYGGIWEGNQSLVALKYAEGKLETDFMARSIAPFLLALFGTNSDSGPSDSAYTHTLSLQNDVQHDSLSLHVVDVNKTELFELAMIESLELTVVPDDVVKVAIEFASKPPADSVTPATPAYVADQKFLGRHCSVKLASLTSGLGAASKLTGLKELRLKISKNLLKNFILGTVTPNDILNRKFEITGSLKLDFTDDTYRDFMENATYRAMRINFNNVDSLIGATSTPQFTLDLSRVHFEGWEKDPSGDEIVMQTINFRALYDITNGNVINSCTLVNADASIT